MTRTIARTLLLAVPLLLAACLDFDSQEVVIRCDQERDRIDVLLVYRGLFAEGETARNQDEALGKALNDLDQALQTGHFAFWCNWPFAIDPTEDPKPPATALFEHLDVEVGGLFTDPQGQLCGYQFVRVRQAKAFLHKLNTLLEAALQVALATGFDGYGPDHKVDGDTKDLIREFLRSGQKLLVVERGRIEFRAPCSAADNRWLKRQIEERFLSNGAREMARLQHISEARARGKPVEARFHIESVDVPGGRLADRLRQSASFRFFWDNDFQVRRDRDLTAIGLGVPGSQELRIVKGTDGLYDDRLLKALRERGDKIEDGVPDQEIRRRFDAFGERDAILPGKLAAKRAK
jgi:hypothetical protein